MKLTTEQEKTILKRFDDARAKMPELLSSLLSSGSMSGDESIGAIVGAVFQAIAEGYYPLSDETKNMLRFI